MEADLVVDLGGVEVFFLVAVGFGVAFFVAFVVLVAVGFLVGLLVVLTGAGFELVLVAVAFLVADGVPLGLLELAFAVAGACVGVGVTMAVTVTVGAGSGSRVVTTMVGCGGVCVEARADGLLSARTVEALMPATTNTPRTPTISGRRERRGLSFCHGVSVKRSSVMPRSP
jgi:hypothetical protein